MNPVNKMLMGELEDMIRQRERDFEPRSMAMFDTDQWAKDRETYINAAASLMVAVQFGDEHAAKAQKDPGTTG